MIIDSLSIPHGSFMFLWKWNRYRYVLYYNSYEIYEKIKKKKDGGWDKAKIRETA